MKRKLLEKILGWVQAGQPSATGDGARGYKGDWFFRFLATAANLARMNGKDTLIYRAKERPFRQWPPWIAYMGQSKTA